MTNQEYQDFLRDNVMSAREVMNCLGLTSRAGISFLVKAGKLKILKEEPNFRLFTRREVEQYKREREGK